MGADVVSRYFRRYDLDASGMIDNGEELEQLTVNLLFACVRNEEVGQRLGMDEDKFKEVSRLVQAAPPFNGERWDQGAFVRWFDVEVLPVAMAGPSGECKT